jgi:hypothetical protein
MPLEEYQHRLLMREKLSVSDEYIFKQWDGDEEIFKHYLTGERYRWTGHGWEDIPGRV